VNESNRLTRERNGEIDDMPGGEKIEDISAFVESLIATEKGSSLPVSSPRGVSSPESMSLAELLDAAESKPVKEPARLDVRSDEPGSGVVKLASLVRN